MSNEPDIEFKVYNRLTRAEESNNRSQKWTLNLFLCCLVVATGSLQFGFNIASMNSVTPVLKNFTYTNFYLFAEYHNQMTLVGYLFGNKTRLEKGKQDYEDAQIEYFSKVFGSTNKTYIDDFNRRKAEKEEFYLKNYNMSIPQYLEASQSRLDEKMAKYEENKWRLEEGRQKVEKATNILWTVTNCLFVIGGMIGTFTGKLVMDLLGRKNAIFVHHMFSIVSGALVLSTPLLRSPVCMMVSRLLYGIQGGMSCTLIPTYLSEISPAALRGQTGVIHQLCITIGIVIAQVLGMRQLLGTDKLWHLLIAGPCVPAVVGALFLMMFMPESPRALLAKDKDSTRSALAFLRNTEDVEDELDDLVAEAKCGGDKETDSEQMVSVFGLFRHRDSRMAIITSLVLHMVQQLSGINAVFFYSSSIFKDAGISAENIQYAILSTGIVNVLTTIVCVPLIDRLGRKPLLVYPMLFIILDFVCLILLLKFKGESAIMSYLSIVCIMLFVMCFAIGLGPIPFIYTAECFRQNARSSAMALSTLFNWSAGLLLTLVFPFMLDLIQQYVFLVFSAIIALALAMIVIKVPETKGKSIEEIIAKFTQFKSDY